MRVDENINRRILVIDDNDAIHEDFHDILCGHQEDNGSLNEAKAALFGSGDETSGSKSEKLTFEVDSAFQGQEGLQKIKEAEREGNPYFMAFVDMRMPPGWDGLETIQHIWDFKPDLHVVICTAYSDYSWQQLINRLGETDKLLILKKPFDNIEVRQLAISLSEKWRVLQALDKAAQHQDDELAQTRDTVVFALASLAESRDPETGEHLERMRSYCQILAEELQQNSPYKDQITDHFIDALYRSSPLHDIGKVGIPDKILLKPGSLTDAEFEIMKQHTIIGANALDKTLQHTNSGDFLAMAATIARYHHERYNGQGYPEGLKDKDIPLAARIVALADVYDALTSARVYKPAFRTEVSKMMIEEETGEHFDPIVVEAFQARWEQFLSVGQEMRAASKVLIEQGS
jgi:putative two-component system response regulator